MPFDSVFAALGAECDTITNGKGLTTAFTVDELHTSLSVMDNQQFAPVSVLARMWNLPNGHAKDIRMMFTSMSLAKASTQHLDGKEECGFYIHALHLDFSRRNACRSGHERVWHRRLLNGHIRPNGSWNQTGAEDAVGSFGLNMLEYTPRPWWKRTVENKENIRSQLSRHLRRAGLDLELGATMLDIRWINAQALTGGLLGLQNDLDILQSAFARKEFHLRER